MKHALTRKLGPLPAWAWLGLFVAAVIVYRHFQTGSLGAAASDTSTPTDVGALDTSSGGGDFGSGGGALQPLNDASPVAPSDPTINSPTGPGTPIIYDPTQDTYGPITQPPGGPGGSGGYDQVTQPPTPTPPPTGETESPHATPDVLGSLVHPVHPPGVPKLSPAAAYRLLNPRHVQPARPGHSRGRQKVTAKLSEHKPSTAAPRRAPVTRPPVPEPVAVSRVKPPTPAAPRPAARAEAPPVSAAGRPRSSPEGPSVRQAAPAPKPEPMQHGGRRAV